MGNSCFSKLTLENGIGNFGLIPKNISKRPVNLF
jgi:hypothetical protein